MVKPIEQPPDRKYILAKSGYNLFAAGYELSRKVLQDPDVVLRNEDLVTYLAAFCDYCLSAIELTGQLPYGIVLHTLKNTDIVLRRTTSRFLNYPIPGRSIIIGSMLRAINDDVVHILRSRAGELEITLSHMKMEEVSTTVNSLESPHYETLIQYHRDLCEKIEVVEFDIKYELEGVYRLLELAGYSPET